MKTVLVGILLCSITAEAGIADKLRTYSSKYLGEDITQKIFGMEESKRPSLLMPVVPKEISKSETQVIQKITSFEALDPAQKRQYYSSFVRELSYVTRGIRIDEEGALKWINVLEQGGSQEGVYHAMVLDRTYQNLESFKESLSNEVIIFLQNYGTKFLNQKFGEDSLKTLNIYSIKRIITEKSLEIADYFQKNPDDLYRWYALMSVKLAEKIETKNKVRIIQDTYFHYSWAKKVPVQHLKAEMIIKLHDVLNQLNAIGKEY